MNENINLCKILKDCQKETKLYSPLFGEVVFCGIEDGAFWPIRVKFHNGDSTVTSLFIKDGRHYNYPNGECLLFPSKDQRDWSKWKCHKPKFDQNTLRPFDKVLIFNYTEKCWVCDFYAYSKHVDKDSKFPFVCVADIADKIIPYNEDTKHLVGTSDEAPEFYRYWED